MREDPQLSERALAWEATMAGHSAKPAPLTGRLRTAHEAPAPIGEEVSILDRAARELAEKESLAEGATHSSGAGRRIAEEAPDEWRTCFERDRDRILHSAAFRRLAGKTQVFVFPADHQRTRLTHALEVAQVATAIARALRLNVALAEAIALGHDCGHGPGGHASEDAFSPYLEGGFDHAVWGAEVTMAGLNLCAETLDGIANHSWSRPAPLTPEGEAVSLADRIAYTAHDLEDAVRAGLVKKAALPAAVSSSCGTTRSSQLRSFVRDVVNESAKAGFLAMGEEMAGALEALRRFCYEEIYLRPDSTEQARRVVVMLRALVEHYVSHEEDLPRLPSTEAGLMTGDAVRDAVGYVAGMTDRYACAQAVRLVGFDPRQLPHGAS